MKRNPFFRNWMSPPGWLLGLSLLTSPTLAQTIGRSNWQGQVTLGGWASSGGAIPFWLRANQWGTASLTTPTATLRAGLWRAYRPDTTTQRRRRFDWSVGAQLVGNVATHSQVLLAEGYVKGRWRSFELALGRWRQLTGLGDSTLSSGFVNGSANAMPIPKIQLATRGYVPLGFTKNFVALSAGFGHGWFTNAYIQGSYLHQKYVYLRLGKPTSRLKGYVGINHEVQWGGQADYLIGSTAAVNGKLPSAFTYYPYLVLGLRPPGWQSTDYTSFDGAYWFGNGLGSTDVGLELRSQRGTWLLYHQHIYEDLSGLLWLNAPDGLTGLSWHRHADRAGGWLTRVVVEWLSTMDQSGPAFDYSASYQGDDNYFNHGQYQQGWSYLGRTIGTPFVMPYSEVSAGAGGGGFFPNNRIKMGYVGAMGPVGTRLNWTLRLAYSRNYGTYTTAYETPLDQFSGLASLQWRLPRCAGTQLIASLFTDQGQLLPATIGGFVGIQKHW